MENLRSVNPIRKEERTNIKVRELGDFFHHLDRHRFASLLLSKTNNRITY